MPALHYTIVVGIVDVVTNTGVLLLLAGLTAYVAGVVIYAFRFPECRWPGRFDIFVRSPQMYLFTLRNICVRLLLLLVESSAFAARKADKSRKTVEFFEEKRCRGAQVT